MMCCFKHLDNYVKQSIRFVISSKAKTGLVLYFKPMKCLITASDQHAFGLYGRLWTQHSAKTSAVPGTMSVTSRGSPTAPLQAHLLHLRHLPWKAGQRVTGKPGWLTWSSSCEEQTLESRLSNIWEGIYQRNSLPNVLRDITALCKKIISQRKSMVERAVGGKYTSPLLEINQLLNSSLY